MTDLLTATQTAVFVALSDPPMSVPVYQHVPENAEPPMIIVGDIEATPGSTKGAEDHQIDIQFIHRGLGRAPLLGIMHAARMRLEGAQLAAENAELGSPQWMRSVVVEAEDGVTYAGLQEYSVEAEAVE